MYQNCGFYLAEKERFELSRRDNRPTPLAGAPLRPLEYFSVYSSPAAGCIGLRHPILYMVFPSLSSPFLQKFSETFTDPPVSLFFFGSSGFCCRNVSNLKQDLRVRESPVLGISVMFSLGLLCAFSPLLLLWRWQR